MGGAVPLRNEEKQMTKKMAAHTDTTNETSTTEGAALPIAYMPPKVGAPGTPTGWAKSKWVKPREGLRPTSTQADAAAPAAAELEKSTTYVDDFGSKAPPVSQIAPNLVTASQWRDEYVSAKNWLAYVIEQRQLWEDKALADVASLKPAYDYAVSRDPSVAKRYPSTKLLVGARSEVAVRAAARRKADKADKADKAAEGAAKAEQAAPSPPGNVAPATPPASKSVTLN
jgi:hypothetical protein